MNANFNRAATSATKSRPVLDIVREHLLNDIDSVGRGSGAFEAMSSVFEARIALADLLHAESPTHIIFTSGATESLNILIGGLIGLIRDREPQTAAPSADGRPQTDPTERKKSCEPLVRLRSDSPRLLHLIISCYEHNAVARPAKALADHGLAVLTVVEPEPSALEDALKAAADRSDIGATVVIMTHASNVFGNVLPIGELFPLAKAYGAYTVLDSSQTLGHIPVAMTEYIDAIAFTGHKGLKALPGSGGFAIRSSFAEKLMPWKFGGTGSISDSLEMPDFLPDKFEAGTPNMLGIIALGAAASHVGAHLSDIHRREAALFSRLIRSLRELPVRIHGDIGQFDHLCLCGAAPAVAPITTDRAPGSFDCEDARSHCIPVVSITIDDYDSSLLSDDLDRLYHIKTRSGLHCAPLAHRHHGTFPEGTLRLSLNSDNTEEEIDHLIRALRELLQL